MRILSFLVGLPFAAIIFLGTSCGSNRPSSSNLAEENGSDDSQVISRKEIETALRNKGALTLLKTKVHAVLDKTHFDLPWSKYLTDGPFESILDANVKGVSAFSLRYTNDTIAVAGVMFFRDIDQSLNKADLIGESDIEGVQLVGIFGEQPAGISIFPSNSQFSKGWARLFVFWKPKTFPGFSEPSKIWITYKVANEPKLTSVAPFSEKDGWSALAPLKPKM